MAMQHGKSDITIDGDIITVKSFGAFNVHGIVNVIKELESAIENFSQKEFKLLFDYLETEGGTPEVFDKINECNIWLNTQNMVAKAVVVNSKLQLAILESRTPARNLQNSQNFSNQADAITWLKTQS